MKIQLVVFDLGRVLVQLCDNWKHASQLAKLPREIAELSDVARLSLHDLVDSNEKGLVNQEQFCEQAARILNIAPEHVAAMSDIYLLETFPGVMDLLDDIRAAGRQTACLSNTNSNHWQRMTSPGNRCSIPVDLLHHHFASHLIGHRKPDPKIYQHVEAETKLAGPQILFFDDMLENVQAARALSWVAEQILPGPQPVAQMRQHLRRLHVLPS
jgi:putative hydrolase of the HAD superfamily